MTKKYKTEAEFGKDIKKLLDLMGIEAYYEVPSKYTNAKFDIVIKKGSKTVILELKLSFNDQLLEQLRTRENHADYVIGVVPAKNLDPKINHVKEFYMLHFKLAVIFIDVDEILEFFKDGYDFQSRYSFKCKYGFPIPNEKYRKLKSRCRSLLHEKGILKKCGGYWKDKLIFKDYQKDGVPGEVSDKALSPAKHSTELILNYLRKHPKCYTFKEIWEKIGSELHWSCYSSMTASIKNYPTKKYKKIIKFMDRRERNRKK